jgi:hypothetical protein
MNGIHFRMTAEKRFGLAMLLSGRRVDYFLPAFFAFQ